MPSFLSLPVLLALGVLAIKSLQVAFVSIVVTIYLVVGNRDLFFVLFLWFSLNQFPYRSFHLNLVADGEEYAFAGHKPLSPLTVTWVDSHSYRRVEVFVTIMPVEDFKPYGRHLDGHIS